MAGKAYDGKDHLPTTLDPSSSEAVSDDLVLEPKHKIFLSHSGAQKDFVEHLCKALEERCRYPFFDRRPKSLEKGKKFPGLILKAAQQCSLFVAVLSEEYLMSKWPMIELNAFVQATREMKSNMNPDILPLFYGLSVSELKDEKRRQRWFERWETFARDDSKGLMKVDDWKFSLDELTKYNGLPYGRELKRVVEYEDEVVSHICRLVRPNIKWEDSHIQGNAHEVIMEKILQVGAPQLVKVKVFGLYGVGGIGKTTSCKKLCNELSNDFEGRVCHIELGSTPSSFKELLQKVLIQLLKKHQEDIEQLEEGECKDMLFQKLKKQKTFLAIDNVWDDVESIKQIRVFLNAPSHPDSLLLVTTRAQETLECLGVDGGACLEMPELGQGDATNLFLHHAAKGQQFTSVEDMSSIHKCVRRCYVSKGDGRGSHYHPLALEALGRQLGFLGKSPFEWKQILPSVWNFDGFPKENEVFGVLRSSFDLLPQLEQELFMDVAIFLLEFFEMPDQYCTRFVAVPESMGWSERLCAQYKQDELRMQSLLDRLKRKGLLQEANLSLGRVSMHDLYRDFAILEAKGKFVEATSFGNRRWVYIDVLDGGLSDLEVTPAGGCWQNLTRLCIRGRHLPSNGGDDPTAYPLESLAGIEWQYFSNVSVLKLNGLNNVKGTLNLKSMKCLRSLRVCGLSCLERLEGFEGLTSLTLFEWTGEDAISPFLISRRYPLDDIVGPPVLRVMLYVLMWFIRPVVEGVQQLDLSSCWSLERVLVSGIQSLQTLLVPSPRKASRLQSLRVERCFNLDDVRGLDRLASLEHLHLHGLYWKKVPNLLSLTKLQTLRVRVGQDPANRLHIPRQLQELHFVVNGVSVRGSNWKGFLQLQVLDLSDSRHLVSMSEMGDLPALRTLNLRSCGCLRRLPDLSKSRDLELLNLDFCSSLELHEEDIQMLATLPSLRPVNFASIRRGETKLDLSRRKVLHYMGAAVYPPESSLNWEEGDWKETELGQPPIKLGDFKDADFIHF